MRYNEILSKLNDRWILYRYIYPFIRKNHDRKISKENTLCLFCQPRGGSTWLAEILLNIPGSVLIDEPLWRGNVSVPFQKPDNSSRKLIQVADLDFFYNQYIPEDSSWKDAQDVFEIILAGRAVSIGLYEEQDLKNLERGNFYISKFNYANLLMPWLIKQFDFKSIVLTRHPCAVIASQLRLPSWCDIDVSNYPADSDFPYSDFYYSNLTKIGSINSRESYLAFIWAMGFINTAMHKDNNKKWLTISYEGLLTNFSFEIERINERYSFDIDISDLNPYKPSKSTKKYSLQHLGRNEQLSSWKSQLSNNQIKNILKVLQKFEIDIYSEKFEPDYNRLY